MADADEDRRIDCKAMRKGSRKIWDVSRCSSFWIDIEVLFVGCKIRNLWRGTEVTASYEPVTSHFSTFRHAKTSGVCRVRRFWQSREGWNQGAVSDKHQITSQVFWKVPEKSLVHKGSVWVDFLPPSADQSLLSKFMNRWYLPEVTDEMCLGFFFKKIRNQRSTFFNRRIPDRWDCKSKRIPEQSKPVRFGCWSHVEFQSLAAYWTQNFQDGGQVWADDHARIFALQWDTWQKRTKLATKPIFGPGTGSKVLGMLRCTQLSSVNKSVCLTFQDPTSCVWQLCALCMFSLASISAHVLVLGSMKIKVVRSLFSSCRKWNRTTGAMGADQRYSNGAHSTDEDLSVRRVNSRLGVLQDTWKSRVGNQLFALDFMAPRLHSLQGVFRLLHPHGFEGGQKLEIHLQSHDIIEPCRIQAVSRSMVPFWDPVESCWGINIQPRKAEAERQILNDWLHH